MNHVINDYKISKIKDIITETKTIKTFVFDWEMKGSRIPKPGQFLMIWNFTGIKNEKPMSISKIDIANNEIWITVKKIGEFTNQLHNLKIGDKLGLRGPYGNGFDIQGNNILAIGGGVGMAPISSFIDLAKEKNLNIDSICASVTKNELLFQKRLKRMGINVFTCTDDGTCGFEGFATDRTRDLLKNSSYDMAIVCGPELMMKGIFDILEDHNIPAQYSMERYMKCAMGICGQCCVDNKGWRVCIEGPVFSSKALTKLNEFGKYHRNSASIKETF